MPHLRLDLRCSLLQEPLGAFRGRSAGEIRRRAIFRFPHAKVFGGEILFIVLWRQLVVQASDHKFSKYDGMEAVVIFTRLFSVLFLGLSPESFITLCSFSLSSTLAANPAMPTSLEEISGREKKWNTMARAPRLACLSHYSCFCFIKSSIQRSELLGLH